MDAKIFGEKKVIPTQNFKLDVPEVPWHFTGSGHELKKIQVYSIILFKTLLLYNTRCPQYGSVL